jgi:hypothetical protein
MSGSGSGIKESRSETLGKMSRPLFYRDAFLRSRHCAGKNAREITSLLPVLRRRRKKSPYYAKRRGGGGVGALCATLGFYEQDVGACTLNGL